jgi:hypothetical protein
MTKQAQFTNIVRETFSRFLDNELDLETLIERLREIELQVMSEEEEETGSQVWFRFFEGDTLKTTISDIEKDLSDTSHPNCRILMQGIAYGLKSNELEVHYS